MNAWGIYLLLQKYGYEWWARGGGGGTPREVQASSHGKESIQHTFQSNLD